MRFDSSVNKVYRNVQEYIEDCIYGLPNEAMLTEQYEALPTVTMSYDSKADTLEHIKRVNELLLKVSGLLLNRAAVHDNSKLGENEKPLFDKYTAMLRGLTYGSPEYRASLDGLKPALDNHYSQNSHHPEHYSNGINGMCLLDLIEMLVDWKAAGERHADGNIFKSLEINKERFGISEQLYEILLNTAKTLF